MRSVASPPPRLLGVHVPSYKNLKDVWVPWSDGLVLLGPNGAGKSNLLEALALVLGTQETLRRGRHRLDFSATTISLIVEHDRGHLPLSPDPERSRKFSEVFPGGLADQLRLDEEWWAGQPDPERIMASDAWAHGVVSYTLESIAPSLDRSQDYDRIFHRQLLDGVAGLDLRAGAPAGIGIELSRAAEPPVEMSWLPRLRSTEEVDADLIAAFEEALPGVEELLTELNALYEAVPHETASEAHWLLHEIAAASATEELTITAPGMEVRSVGGGDAHWSLRVPGEAAPFEIGETGTEHLLERLSAAQQRWADEAFASMSSAMRAYGRRSRAFASLLRQVPAEYVTAAGRRLAKTLDQIRSEEYWSFESFSLFMRELEPALVVAGDVYAGDDERAKRLLRAVSPHFAELAPRKSVRAFDEPEAHLHLREQRRIARSLDKLRLRGHDIVIASHAPAFLDISAWKPLRVAHGRVSEIEGLDAPAQTQIARDLGATRGELLAGISALLVVEGEHDRLVVERCFGTELRAAGVVMLAMRGTENLSSVLALDFVQRYMDVPPTIMIDFTVAARVRNGTGKTSEERKLVELTKRAEDRNFAFSIIGLSLPDIVCYLDGDAVASHHPDFPGWDVVLDAFLRLRPRPKFKEWLLTAYNVDLRSSARIEQVLDTMAQQHMRPGGQLVREVNALLARLDE